MDADSKFDFFVDIDGKEHVVEVFDCEDGYATEYSVYPLLEDGGKGEPLDDESLSEETQVEIQSAYRDYIDTMFDDYRRFFA